MKKLKQFFKALNRHTRKGILRAKIEEHYEKVADYDSSDAIAAWMRVLLKLLEMNYPHREIMSMVNKVKLELDI